MMLFNEQQNSLIKKIKIDIKKEKITIDKK